MDSVAMSFYVLLSGVDKLEFVFCLLGSSDLFGRTERPTTIWEGLRIWFMRRKNSGKRRGFLTEDLYGTSKGIFDTYLTEPAYETGPG